MTAALLTPSPENIARAAEALRRGELVGMPTETVYGLAGNALDAAAVSRIFAAKERPTFDPLIVHVAPDAPGLAPLEQLGLVDGARLSEVVREQAEALIHAFWPGPLTLVLPRGPKVPDLVTSGLPRVAVRMPRHPVAQALIRAAGVPLAAPSANRFGRISPTSAADVVSELGDRIGLVLDGGTCQLGVESTVLLLDDEAPVLLRPGGAPREDVEKLLGRPVARASQSGDVAQLSPGLLASHYAPRKPLHLLAGPLGTGLESPTFSGELPASIGVLAQSGDAAELQARLERTSARRVRVEVLSARGELDESARRLFAALRALDASDAEVLFAEPCPSEAGLGYAIADRLRRASIR
ncbi:MAG: threonylcarbamoyl-AMP synthase [Deltaproteobacteria bacterium]|nr:threonylcarbamoyl-AMP synthase [Deltaproteobacteria bacterium]